MAKFRYYITDTFDGVVKGTDESSVASELAQCEEYFVVDTVSGKMLSSDGSRMDINEF